MLKKMNTIINAGIILLITSSHALAQSSGAGDAEAAAKDFSGRILTIVQGPVIKLMAAVVLLVGVAGLLRGRHKLAVSCGVAFLLLLFLPLLLGKFQG